jgi:hypothetical protein
MVDDMPLRCDKCARRAKLEYDNTKLRDALDQLSLVARAAPVSRSKKESAVLRAALTEARRFMDYFANGRTKFVGPGTPLSCLEHIDWALNPIDGSLPDVNSAQPVPLAPRNRVHGPNAPKKVPEYLKLRD